MEINPRNFYRLYGAKGSKTLFLEKKRIFEPFFLECIQLHSATEKPALVKEISFMYCISCMMYKNTKLKATGKMIQPQNDFNCGLRFLIVIPEALDKFFNSFTNIRCRSAMVINQNRKN